MKKDAAHTTWIAMFLTIGSIAAMTFGKTAADAGLYVGETFSLIEDKVDNTKKFD